LLLMNAGRPGDAGLLERGAWTEAESGATAAGLLETARGTAAAAVAGRGVLLMKTGGVGAAAAGRTTGAAAFGRKTATLWPELLTPTASGAVTSFIVYFGTGAFVAAAICSALTPALWILCPAKE
jgi:hypothetical protein